MKREEILKLKSFFGGEENFIGIDGYLQAAVLVPLFEKDNELHILFEKRAANIRQGGEISFPGGEIEEKDGSPLETAIRETVEELGIQYDKIKPVTKLGALISPRGVIVHAFVGEIEIKDLSEISCDKQEVEKVFSIPVSYFERTQPESYILKFEIQPYYINENGEKVELLPVKKLNLPERYARPWTGRGHKVLVYKSKGEVIWGLTAQIINELVKRI